MSLEYEAAIIPPNVTNSQYHYYFLVCLAFFFI
ncbi:hypothetical protein VCHENC02_4119, partial [Vibrio harveyi]